MYTLLLRTESYYLLDTITRIIYPVTATVIFKNLSLFNNIILYAMRRMRSALNTY
jgi:hypothetical protein